MKPKIIALFLAGALVGGAAVYIILPGGKPGRADRAVRTDEIQLYSCGMHPEVISDEPGNCPICGMELTPLRGSSKPGAVEAGATGGERKILYWRAPMDPTEIYDQPGKSKMGMDLIPVYEGEEADGAGSMLIDGTVRQNMNVRTESVRRRDISRTVRVFGRVAFAQDRESSVTTKISGWVEKLHVNSTGQRVRKGDPLLEIYSPELVSTQEEFLLAMKNMKESEASPYESVRAGAERMLVLARSRLEFWDIPTAEIERIAEIGKIRRTVLLRSQVGGVVTHKAVVEGDRVGPGMVLFHISDLDRVWVEAAVYESDLPSVRQGQSAEIEIDQLQGLKVRGRVDFIFPFLDQKSRANNIRMVLDNPGHRLKPDMFATVTIHSDVIPGALVIPAEAVIHSGKRDIVFVDKGEGKFEPREVRTGVESDEGTVQIVSGLFESENVVVSGQFMLDSESRTREAIAKMRAAQAQAANGGAKEQEKDEDEKQAPEHSIGSTKVPAEIHEHGRTAAVPARPSTKTSGTTATPGHDMDKPGILRVDMNNLYACPMHPDFITTDPNADCSECGMKPVKVKELGDKVDLEKAEFYTCSMHPEFLTTDPAGRCPECGVKLEKVKKAVVPAKGLGRVEGRH